MMYLNGANPNNMPAQTETPIVNHKTDQSIDTRLPNGRVDPASRTRNGTAIQAINKPSAALESDNRTLSVKSWRKTRNRLAPMARRTANSCWRPAELANSKLATLVQAISNTNATAPMSTNRAGRALSTI